MQNRSQTTYIGLNNKPCADPKYYCRSHQVFLSDDDIVTKKCMCKPTFDMLTTHPCKWLMTMDEYRLTHEKSDAITCRSSEETKGNILCKYWQKDGSETGFCTYYNRPCNTDHCRGVK